MNFTFAFVDQDRAPITPPAAKLYLYYRIDGDPSGEVIDLTAADGKFSGSWQSTIADVGSLDWHVRSEGTDQVAVRDGSIQIRGNKANPSSDQVVP